MHLKELKRIFCGLLILVMVFGYVGSHQAFCLTEDEKKVEELIGYVTKGYIDSVNRWLTENKEDADRLLKCKVTRWYKRDGSCYDWSQASYGAKPLSRFREVQLNVIEVVANEVVEVYEDDGERWHTYYWDAKSGIDRKKVKDCVRAILGYIANSTQWGADKFIVTSPPAGKQKYFGSAWTEFRKAWDVWLRGEFKKDYADKHLDRFEIIETRRVWICGE